MIHSLTERLPKLPRLTLAFPRKNAAELIQIAGFGAVSYGVWLYSRGAGIITVGILAVLEAFSLERRT